MKSYQLTYLIAPETEENRLVALKEKIKSLIQERQGVLAKETDIIKKKLGYEIKNKSLAYFKSIEFQLSPEHIKEIEKEIKNEKDILRFFLISLKPARENVFRKSSRTSLKTPLTKPETEKKKIELKEIEKKLEEILE